MNAEMNGVEITARRETRRMGRRELASKAGISERTLAKVEDNRGAVQLHTARKIGCALGVESLTAIARPAGR